MIKGRPGATEKDPASKERDPIVLRHSLGTPGHDLSEAPPSRFSRRYSMMRRSSSWLSRTVSPSVSRLQFPSACRQIRRRQSSICSSRSDSLFIALTHGSFVFQLTKPIISHPQPVTMGENCRTVNSCVEARVVHLQNGVEAVAVALSDNGAEDRGRLFAQSPADYTRLTPSVRSRTSPFFYSGPAWYKIEDVEEGDYHAYQNSLGLHR